MDTKTSKRPFACSHPGCSATYMRATHLAAHMRSHMEESEKPFECTHSDCGKRFWTSQHLRRHIVSCHTPFQDGIPSISATDAHEMLGNNSLSGLYKCTHGGCCRIFSKRKHLRQHVRDAHADFISGELPYACEHEGCDKRFATYSKRQHHMRVHEKGRYQCVLPHLSAPPAGHPPYTIDEALQAWSFSTWTHLQRHMRLYHPPTCHQCGKVFANRENLKRHHKTHAMYSSSEEQCPWNGCDKVFQTQYALKVHISRVHEGFKPFLCEVCGKRFGYKHLLERHQQLHDRSNSSEAETLAHSDSDSHPHLSSLIGSSRKRARRERVLPCPWPMLSGQASSEVQELEPCSRKFARLYDVRRHLASVHGLHVSDAELKTCMPEAVLALLPPPRTVKRIRHEV